MKQVVTVRNLKIGEGMPKICVPIIAETEEEILRKAEEILTYPVDLIEWRVDFFENAYNLEAVEAVLSGLREILGETPLLFTFRTEKQGGCKDMVSQDYFALNLAVAMYGCVDLIDLEIYQDLERAENVIAMLHGAGIKVIASHHDFDKTPTRSEIMEKLSKMEELGADILKIAVMPNEIGDVARLLKITGRTSINMEKPLVTMAMGEMGMVTRIAGESFGSDITFGSIGETSAPGQLQVEDLRKVLEILHKYHEK
ncbi:MAG: type I 3-dehydroquinate dehydratase [Lachnospiraceae bacterium]